MRKKLNFVGYKNTKDGSPEKFWDFIFEKVLEKRKSLTKQKSSGYSEKLSEGVKL